MVFFQLCAQKLIRYLQEKPGAVTCCRVRAGRPSVLKIDEHLDALLDDTVAW